MSLDVVSLAMIEPLLRGADVLCLGDPDMPAGHPDGTFKAYARHHGATRVDTVDIIAHKGFEQIVNLNLTHEWLRRYNLVINPGTLEHCFNIGQAFMNAWNALAVGGHAVHIAPATMLNHGYWNVNPIAFIDWCEVNGGRVCDMRFARNGDAQHAVTKQPIPNSKSGRGCFPPETVVYALLRKMKMLPGVQWPQQGVYR